MKRLSLTVADHVQRTVDEIGLEGRVRQVIKDWFAQRGERAELGSESARLRAMLDIGDATIRSLVLEVGYEDMASWHNERSAAEREAWQRRRDRSVRQWAAEEARA